MELIGIDQMELSGFGIDQLELTPCLVGETERATNIYKL